MQNDLYNYKKFKKPLFILLAIFLILIIVIIVTNIITGLISDSTDIVDITGLNACATDVPHDTEVWVEKRAYEYATAQLEIDSAGPAASQYQGVLRQDSCALKEFTDEAGHTGYTAEFILDIAELQYSFSLKFSYVKAGSPALVGVDMGAPTLYCPPEDELIYSAFDCTNNPLIQASGVTELYDIQNFVPYTDADGHYYLQLAASTETKSGYTIVITYLPGTEYYLNGNIEEYRQTYRAAAEAYLTSNHQDLSDFDFFEKWK